MSHRSQVDTLQDASASSITGPGSRNPAYNLIASKVRLRGYPSRLKLTEVLVTDDIHHSPRKMRLSLGNVALIEILVNRSYLFGPVATSLSLNLRPSRAEWRRARVREIFPREQAEHRMEEKTHEKSARARESSVRCG